MWLLSKKNFQSLSGRVASSLLAGALFVFASQAMAARDFEPHSGYVMETAGEREEVSTDLVLMHEPDPEGPSLHDRIFNEKLIKEFRERYEEKFGRTEVERVSNAPNRFTYYQDLYGFKGTPEEMTKERQKYAEFMMRRLVEYHVDNYAKSDPSLKGAWEAKERIQAFKVSVQKVRFDVKYNLSSNTLDLKVINPYLSMSRVRLELSGRREAIYSIGRSITDTIAFESHYKVVEGVVSVIGTKALTPRLGSSVLASTFTNRTGETISVRETKYLAGLSYSF